MRRRYLKRMALGLGVGAGTLLAMPALASAASGPTLDDAVSSINTTWVIVAGSLVMFMQAGFAFLEIGFSRAKNAGTVVAKILTNFSIAAIAWWAIGFMFAFSGPAGSFIGHEGGAFFTHLGPYLAVVKGITFSHPHF